MFKVRSPLRLAGVVVMVAAFIAGAAPGAQAALVTPANAGSTAGAGKTGAAVATAKEQRGIVPRVEAGTASAAGAPQGLTAAPDPSKDKGVTPAQARAKALASGNQTYRPATPSAGGVALRSTLAPPATPDPAFAEECNNSYAASADEFGFVKNRFQWCRNMIAFHNIIDTRGNRTGFMWMDLTIIGYGRDDGQRNVRLFVHPNAVVFGLSYTPTTKFGLDIVCVTNIQSCQEPDDHKLTMAEWLALQLSGGWLSFTVGSDPTEGLGPDKVLWHDFAIEAEYFDGISSFNGDYGIRCDSAQYIPGRPAACIFFDVIPHLQYWIQNADGTDSPHRAVAEHIRQAQDQPGTTWPPKSDGSPKVIPGKYTGEASEETFLERISSDSERYAENRRAKDAACAGLTRPGDYQCDEYPFASTWQGGGLGDGNFSVKYVPQPDNSSAGGSLVNYYNSDRILYLEYDFFYVQILDRPEQGGGDGRPVVSAGPQAEGNEGEALRLYGSVRDLSPRLTVQWQATPVEGVDPGGRCLFSDPTAVQPTITCNDDGVFLAELSVNDGVNPTARAATLVRVHNVAPFIRFTEPTGWQLFRVGAPIFFDAPFTDPGTNDTHLCQFNFDEGAGADPAFPPSVPGNCGLVHGYDHAGMYTVTVSVSDDDGAQDTTTVMIVVYDPNEGSVNIDGNTPTPHGALVSDPSVTGGTWVHFTAQYPLGGSVPYGQAKAWVQNTSFRLEPTGMEWLVITEDGKVAGRGTGTVAGQAGYTWVMYAWDACGTSNPGCQNIPGDQVRLVVFETATGRVVYDHSPGSGEYDVDRISPTTMTSGQVLIQRWPR